MRIKRNKFLIIIVFFLPTSCKDKTFFKEDSPYDRAKSYMKEAERQRNPKISSNLYLQAGIILLNIPGREEEGIKSLNLACKVSEDKSACLKSGKLLGDYYSQRGDYSSALENYYNAFDLTEEKKEREEIGCKIGYTFLKTGNYSQLKLFMHALEKEGMSSDEVFFLLSEAEERTGNIQGAITYCEKIINLSRDLNARERAYRKLINLYEMSNKLKDALKVAQTALQEGFDSEFIKWKITNLKRRLELRRGR